MLRRMGVDELYIDAYWIKEDRLKLAFMPPPFFIYDVCHLPPKPRFWWGAKPDIIFLDLGPGIVSRKPSEPTSGSFHSGHALLESMRSRTYPKGRIRTFFVLSKVPYGARSAYFRASMISSM